MGLAVAAGIAAVGSLAATGYQAYSANKANKASQANIGQLRGGLAEAMKNVPNVAPVSFDRLKLAPVSDIFKSYLGQGRSLPGVTNFAMKQNDAWQKILDKASPGLSNSVRLGGRLTESRLKGELSAETQANVARSGAYKALQGGFGADSKAGRALESRDLGRTTEDLQTLGFNMLPQQGQMAAALSPVAPHTVFFSPQQLAARGDTEAMFNTQVGNSEKAYNTSIDFENQNAKFSALMQSAGINYQAGAAGISSQQAFDTTMAQSIGQLGNSLASIYGSFGGPGQANAQTGLYKNGFYNSAAAAQSAAGWQAPVTQYRPGQFYIG